MDGQTEVLRSMKEALKKVEDSAESLRGAIAAMEGDNPPSGPSQEDMNLVGHVRDIVVASRAKG